MIDLRSLYGISGNPVVTAHRGFSGKYPENTLLAFSKAQELGADIIEFDVRESSDGSLVIMHDALLDRTTSGKGPVKQRTLHELKRLNASFWHGPHDTGARVESPDCEEKIPTLEEALALLAGRVGLNIQVYTKQPASLKKIARLYLDHELQSSGFLMLRLFAEGDFLRAISKKIAICIGEERANLERHLSFGVDYIQPTRNCLSESYIRRLLASGVPANVFYANDTDTMLSMIKQGIPGIMTDRPDALISLRKALQEPAL